MSNTTKIIGVVILAILLIGGYMTFSGGDDVPDQPPAETSLQTQRESAQPTDTQTEAAPGPGGAASNRGQTLRRLNRLREINIDTDFFSSEAFLSLENYGIRIEPQPAGRSNPFSVSQSFNPAEVSKQSEAILTPGTSTESSATTSDQLTETQEFESGNAASEQGAASTSTTANNPPGSATSTDESVSE